MGVRCSRNFNAKNSALLNGHVECTKNAGDPGCQSNVQGSMTMLKSNSMSLVSFSCNKKVSMSLADDDVMIYILHRLPLKDLLKAKCVCKWWYQLISDPLFISIYSHQHSENHVSGFFLQKFLFLEMYSKLEFFTCEGQLDAAPEPSLSFIEDDNGVYIRHSSNGLLLCSSFRCHEEHRKYYICKPTTKQYRPLPKPECRTVFGINIVYDPRGSLHYKIICVCDSELSEGLCKIKIYESASGTWRDSRSPQCLSQNLLLSRGVLWNDALHWIGRETLSMRFDIKREHVLTMPMPPIPEGWSERRLAYFGESGDHLYLIEVYGPRTSRFKVREMLRDYSSWFVKYHIDLGGLTHAYPSMVREHTDGINRYFFSVLHIVDRHVGNKDESCMVLHIPGNFISYNLKEGTVMELHSFSYEIEMVNKNLGLWYSWEGVYPFVNTVSYL